MGNPYIVAVAVILGSSAVAQDSLPLGEWIGGIKTAAYTAAWTLEVRANADTGSIEAVLDAPGIANAVFDEVTVFDEDVILASSTSGAELEATLENGALKGRGTAPGTSNRGPFVFVHPASEHSEAELDAAFRHRFFNSIALLRIAVDRGRRGDLASTRKWVDRAVSAGASAYALFSREELAGVVDTAEFRSRYRTYSSAFPELSQVSNRVTEREVKLPMRDGVELGATLLLPPGDGPFPTVLVRTPYGRRRELGSYGDYATRGYVFAAVSCRGRDDSGGRFVPWLNERKDGFDTLEWIREQSWSNGKVGMIGGSYLGQVQWAAAAEAPPALTCIVPLVPGTDHFFENPYDHGIFLMGLIDWAGLMDGAPPGRRDRSKLATLPLSKVDDEYLGIDSPIWNRWLELDSPGAWASANFLGDLAGVDIPVMHTSGWWDGEAIATQQNWARMRALKKADQYLVMGPWPHELNRSTRFADVDYGPTAVRNLRALWLRWFDHWLKGKDVGLDAVPVVDVFVTGRNAWRRFSDWPPKSARKRAFYLASNQSIRGAAKRGAMAPLVPESQPPDEFVFDPRTVGPQRLSPARTTKVSFAPAENDVLIYQSAPFDAARALAGPADLDLYFSTSARDTDIFVWVVDVDPQGEMRLLCDPGKMRMRYVYGWDTPAPLEPGEVYHATIPLYPFAHEFAAGHRIGVILRSELFPRFDRNLGTGARVKHDTETVVQRQKIYHDSAYPSALNVYEIPIRASHR